LGASEAASGPPTGSDYLTHELIIQGENKGNIQAGKFLKYALVKNQLGTIIASVDYESQ
jgi:hypothetical protein